MFAGCHEHVLDDKGRTSLPKEFRLALEERNGDPWLTTLPHCLAILPPDVFADYQERLGTASLVSERVQDMQRLLIGGASRCPVDRQGRILIPARLREWAGIQREITILGATKRIEIWDRARYQGRMQHIKAHFADYEDTVKERDL
jgi:MraZ protein